MAKVFTVDVAYKSSSYSALVTVRSREKDHAVYVHFFDSNIMQYLPDGEMYFTISSAMRTPAVPRDIGNRELYFNVREVVLNYLKAQA